MPTLYRQFSSQAEIDAQYNAGASVPDFLHFAAQWKTDSEGVRARLPARLDVPYGPTLAETLDIFPAEQPGSPVLVFLHGGYWRSFSSKEFSFVAAGLRARGFTTVVVDYALCPWVSIDEIVRQARASLAWVHRYIAEHNGDPGRIAVAGHSAGGHMAMMSLLTPWQERYGLPDDLVRAAVSISGLHDLTPLRWSYLQPSLQLDDGVIARNSPQHLVRRVAAPVLVTWGERESAEFERQGRDFAQALQAHGTQVECRPTPHAHHFNVLDGLRDAGSPLCDWLGRALAS